MSVSSPSIWDLMLTPGNQLEPEIETLIGLKLISFTKLFLIATIPAFREIAFIIALICWLGGILGIIKSYQYAGASLSINLFLGLMYNALHV